MSDRNESLFSNGGERKRAAEIIKKQLKTSEVKFIPFLKGRPKRPEGLAGRITKDDVLNLSILLRTSKSIEEFLDTV